MSRSPPLRFLVLLLAGWGSLRAAWLAPAWWAPPAEAGGGPRAAAGPRAERAVRTPPAPTPPAPRLRRASRGPMPSPGPERRRAAVARAIPAPAAGNRLAATPAWSLAPRAAAARAPRLEAARRPEPAAAAPRWSFASWSFLRRGDAPSLAAGGLLGGSQAGARLGYRVDRDSARPLVLVARVAVPVRRPAGGEAAVGIDWRPSRRLPLHLVAERRQKLGREGRSAFGATVYGGVGDAALGPVRVDAYAQAGVVGARSRDLFGDGALRLSLAPAPRARLGAGLWAAAQPGLARLDVGPQAALRLPVAGRSVTVAADWRLRIAGNARPGSGPTLTLSTDF